MRKIFFIIILIIFSCLQAYAALYTGGSGGGESSAQFGPQMFSGGSGSGYSCGTSTDMAVGYGAAAKLSFTTSPSSGAYAGGAFATQPVVKILDAYDNIVYSATNTITLAIANDGAGSGSTLGGTAEMSAVSGVADFAGKGVYTSRAGSGFTISASSSGLTSAVSSAFNTVSPIQVTAPNGAETWTISTAYNITWNTSGSLATGTNTIAYSLNNGGSWTTLTTSGTSPYSWVTPSSTSIQASIKITNSADATFTDTSDAVFTLAAGFNLIVPDGGETWAQGFAHTIQWATRGTVENVKLEYYDGAAWNSITDSTANLNQYSWTPSLSSGGTGFKVRVSDVTNANAKDESLSTLTLQKIALATPTSGQRIQTGSSASITWSAQGVSTVKIQYSLDDGTSWTQISGAESLSAGLGTYSWDIPSSFTTSANTKVRVVSTTADSDGNYAVSTSSAFTIYGQLTVSIPSAAGIEWAAGTPHNITWVTNKGTITNVKLEYSLDNFIEDVNTITASTSNTGTYSWIPASTGINYKIRVSDAQDSQTSDISDNYFSITGIGITAPASGATWNCSSTQNITWNYTGSFNFVKIEYYNGSSWSTIVNSVANTGSYSWAVPSSPTNAAQVRISDASDGDPVGSSSTFNIKSVLAVTAPNGGESLSAGDSTNITWTNTGTVNNVKLEYYDGSSWVTIINSTANTNPASGGNYSWTVPATLTSAAKVRVSDVDANHPSSSDESDTTFTIKAGFAVTSPASAVDWAVNEIHNITWTNTAAVTNVRLYYATEVDSYATWTEITSGAEANTNTYSWTVPDIIQALGRDPQTYPTLGVKIKVVDATSGNPASSSISSAFNVIYYTITFSVKDSETNAHLSALSVTCTSGWSATNRTSGVNAVHKYTYGPYTTVWSRTGYDDKSVDWTADASKTVSVTMTGSLVDTIVYNVYSNFTYDAPSAAFKINSWLEKTGKTVSTPTSCAIRIYDKDNQQIDILSSTSADANGVFRLDWDTSSLDSGTTYFARVEVVSRSSTYSSQVVYSISIPQSLELSSISSTVSDISTSVGSNLGTNVSTIQTSVGSDLGTNVSAVQSSVGSSLGTNVSAIQSSVGTNLGTKIDTLQTDINAVKAAVGASESTTLYSSVGTLISELGSGNISAIRTSTDSLTGGDLGGLSTNVSAIKAKTDNINWDDIGTIKAKTDTINWSDVTTVKSNLSTLSTTVDTLSTNIDAIGTNVTSVKAIIGTTADTAASDTLYGKLQGAALGASSVSDGWGSNTAEDIITEVNNLQDYLGTPSDAAGQLTVFGKIADISAQTGEVSTINTTLTEAYDEVQNLRDELAFNGKSDTAYSLVNKLSATIEEIKKKISEVSNKLGETQISEVAASVEETKDALRQAAQATGALAGIKEAPRPTGAMNLESLQNEVKEIKAMMQAVKTIVEKQEEPAIKSSFENE